MRSLSPRHRATFITQVVAENVVRATRVSPLAVLVPRRVVSTVNLVIAVVVMRSCSTVTHNVSSLRRRVFTPRGVELARVLVGRLLATVMNASVRVGVGEVVLHVLLVGPSTLSLA